MAEMNLIYHAFINSRRTTATSGINYVDHVALLYCRTRGLYMDTTTRVGGQESLVDKAIKVVSVGPEYLVLKTRTRT